MSLLFFMFGFVIIVIIDNVISVTKYKSDHRVPSNEIEKAKGWYDARGPKWMMIMPWFVPEEIEKESWYEYKMFTHSNNNKEEIEKSYPYDYKCSHVTYPNKKVWDEYWIKEAGTPNYDLQYYWLKYPSGYDEWGYELGTKHIMKDY